MNPLKALLVNSLIIGSSDHKNVSLELYFFFIFFLLELVMFSVSHFHCLKLTLMWTVTPVNQQISVCLYLGGFWMAPECSITFSSIWERHVGLGPWCQTHFKTELKLSFLLLPRIIIVQDISFKSQLIRKYHMHKINTSIAVLLASSVFNNTTYRWTDDELCIHDRHLCLFRPASWCTIVTYSFSTCSA